MKTIFTERTISKQNRFNYSGIVKFKLYSFILLFFFVFNTKVTAQPVSASVAFSPAATGYVNGTCFVTLPDSTGVSEVEVTLINAVSDSVMFLRSYLFDITTGLPSGLTWQRTGTLVTLGTGILPKSLGWFGRVRLRNASGTWSDPLEFLFQ